MPLITRPPPSVAPKAPRTFVSRAAPERKGVFVFRPHPYVVEDGRIVVDDWALNRFRALLSRRFESPVPGYRICENLDIHRCVLAEWLDALSRRDGDIKTTRDGIVFRQTDAQLGIANLKPATLYDPWRDRSCDAFMRGYYAAFPWFVIDKYYLIATDEVLAFTGEHRIRPDGRRFTPVDREALAVFKNGQGWKRGEWPEDRYRALCEAASCEDQRSRSNIDRRITARIDADKARREAEAARYATELEAKIDRLGVRGHNLEGFIRLAPHTRDEYVIRCLAEEQSRREAEARWREQVKRDPRLARFDHSRKAPRLGLQKPRPRQGHPVRIKPDDRGKDRTVRA